MKKIKIEDIKKGEIYTSTSKNTTGLFIWEASQNGVLKFRNQIFTREQKDIVNIGISKSVSGVHHSWRDNYKSTSEEKQWLLNCVRLNKSISLKYSNKIEKDKKKPLKSKIAVDKKGNYLGSQTKEGAIFQIGDIVTPVEGVNKGKPFTIESFRWNNANTEICAITDTHKPYGIGIDKIELHTFVLPEKWSLRITSDKINDAVNSIELWNNGSLYWKNEEEYINCHIRSDGNYGPAHADFTEITFEQFKKYVLNEN